MKKLTMDEMKAIELDVLCKIHEVCISQGINYSLAYGTLLGAIRNKGFIPWDDDIDLLMPRDDYEKFMEYCASHETPFYVISHRTDPTWPFLNTRVCDPNTVIPDEPIWKWRGKMGLFVDVFVIDGLNDDFRKATRKFHSSIFKMNLANASNWSHFFKTSPQFKRYYDLIRFFYYVLGKFVNSNKMLNSVEWSSQKRPITSVNYSSALAEVAVSPKKAIMDSSIFTEFTNLEFEGKTFRGIKKYDKYLTQLYGDYLKLPLKEQQIGHYYVTAFRGETKKYNAYYSIPQNQDINVLQSIQLELLKEFDRVCQKNNLIYFLAWGTCIGAVRHKGFIPWDDDLDVMMPLGDYDKLENLYRNEFADGYFLQSYESEPLSGLTFKKLRKNNTTLIDKGLDSRPVHHGIAIDIYPLCNLADGKLTQRWQYVNQVLWLLFTVAKPPKNHGCMMAMGARAVLGIVPQRFHEVIRMNAYKQLTKPMRRDTEFICTIQDFGSIGKKYRKKAFEKVTWVPFEDMLCPIPEGYHEYLTESYGDYMKLPPEEERWTKWNDILFWSADIPYMEYEKIVGIRK